MKSLTRIAATAVMAAAAASAGAATITNLDGTYAFGGFDWASNGSVWIQGYDVTSASTAGTTDTFTLTYMANAVAFEDPSGANYGSLAAPGLNNTYEYTIFATVNEQVTCISSSACTAVQIDVLNGTWKVYYDTNTGTFFNPSAGTGVTNGANILSGIFASSPASQSIFGPQGPTNPGNIAFLAALVGSVTFTDTAYINPELVGTTAVSTLQFGSTTTAWTRPSTFDGVSDGSDTNSSFVGQADANQSFRVPEPSPLALAGLGLGLMGLVGRRRQA